MLALLLCSALCRADTIWVGSGENSLELSKIRITRIDSGKILFESSAGHETSRPLESVLQVQADGEVPLNAAERAYAATDWPAATDQYLRTLRTSSKPWVKHWSALRLLESAVKADRFDAAVSAYVMLVQVDAETAHAEPQLPAEADSPQLATAVTEVQKASANTKLAPRQRQALLEFLLELHQARGDMKAADAALEQLMTVAGFESEQLPRLRLKSATIALQAKQFQRVIDEINANRAIFIAPEDQAEALFYLAEAQYGLAGEDAEKLQDAALAYMRVVAHFKDQPAPRQVPQSLLSSAGICERLSDQPAALRLYRQILAEFGDSPAATAARQRLAQLQSQTQTRQ